MTRSFKARETEHNAPTLPRPDANDFEIEQALRRARIWDWIDQLPDRPDTFVGEEGRELSGGQRQRIALARAGVGLMVYAFVQLA